MILKNEIWYEIIPSTSDQEDSEIIDGKWLYFDNKDFIHSLIHQFDELVENKEIKAIKITRKIPEYDPFPEKPCAACFFTSYDPKERKYVKNLLKRRFNIEVKSWKSEKQTEEDWKEEGLLRVQFEIHELSKQINLNTNLNKKFLNDKIIKLSKKLNKTLSEIDYPHKEFYFKKVKELKNIINEDLENDLQKQTIFDLKAHVVQIEQVLSNLTSIIKGKKFDTERPLRVFPCHASNDKATVREPHKRFRLDNNAIKEIKKSSMKFSANSIVRIHSNNGTTVGAGFFLGKNQIISCAHVISSALDIPKETHELPKIEIHLDFPLFGAQPQIARVILWKPKDDIAVLELLGILPRDGTHTAPLVVETDLWGHPFRVFGFPYGYDNGVWAAGVFRGQTPKGWIQIEGITIMGFFVQPGFSGAPVWDEKLGGVVGLIIAAEFDSTIRTGYVIPTSRLLQAWPALINYCVETKKPSTLDRQLKIFLCHASSDRSAGRELYFRLRAEGMNPWFYEESLLPGQQWELEIPKAVRSSDIILICLSNNSITKSGYVQKEIEYALDVMEEKPEGVIFIIPVRLEECKVPERLRSFQWVNLFESQGYDRLINTLKVCADTL